jgi:hypothetical protein
MGDNGPCISVRCGLVRWRDQIHHPVELNVWCSTMGDSDSGLKLAVFLWAGLTLLDGVGRVRCLTQPRCTGHLGKAVHN